MSHPSGFNHIPYLPEPSRVPTLTIVVDFDTPFDTFYSHVATMTSPAVGSFQEFLMSMEQDILVDMTVRSIEAAITRGAYSTGIGYADIADLGRHPEARRSLYAGELSDAFEHVYRPQIDSTQQYHLTTIEHAMTDVIQETSAEYTRMAMTPEDDVILWRTLYACIIIVAKTISNAGRVKGISEHALVSYSIEDYAHLGGAGTYVLTLKGP